MYIKYGIISNNIDVTDICLSKLTYNNIITIPSDEYQRSYYFSDPLFGTLKSIIIINKDSITEYEHFYTIKINILDNTITTINNNDINNKISDIHSKLKIKYGSFNDELPEQKMVVRYLTGNEKILEIGGNIGRNSLIISHILETKNASSNSNTNTNMNFVSLESDINIANQLRENRDLNNFNFHIESSALSKRKLIQKGWDTIVSDTLADGYQWVNTITLNELNKKYNIEFDTLVLDCEGAFYYILMDMPEILENITLIIMENDYTNINHKIFIDQVLKENNFYRDYMEGNGWGPCIDYFFEVWKKE